jgi:hypothetical protein
VKEAKMTDKIQPAENQGGLGRVLGLVEDTATFLARGAQLLRTGAELLSPEGRSAVAADAMKKADLAFARDPAKKE